MNRVNLALCGMMGRRRGQDLVVDTDLVTFPVQSPRLLTVISHRLFSHTIPLRHEDFLASNGNGDSRNDNDSG